MAQSLPSFRRQSLLIEYASLKHVRPLQIYVSLSHNDPSSWIGVLFVRKGPYSPSVLRFNITFPSGYPSDPPLITFVTDVFHPLLTPLTYTAGLSDADPTRSGGEERLLPGGFSLRHGFPHWFQENKYTAPPLSDPPKPASSPESDSVATPSTDVHQRSQNMVEDISVVELLTYMRNSFEEESILDSVPFEGAANPGAWYAWRTYRGMSRSREGDTTDPEVNGGIDKSGVAPTVSQQAKSSDTPNSSRPRRPSQWNWEGVWEERVKRAIHSTLSEPSLYGQVNNRDELNFVHVEDESEAQEIRGAMLQHLENASS